MHTLHFCSINQFWCSPRPVSEQCDSSLGDPAANPTAVCHWQWPARNTRIVWAPASHSTDQISICQQSSPASQQDGWVSRRGRRQRWLSKLGTLFQGKKVLESPFLFFGQSYFYTHLYLFPLRCAVGVFVSLYLLRACGFWSPRVQVSHKQKWFSASVLISSVYSHLFLRTHRLEFEWDGSFRLCRETFSQVLHYNSFWDGWDSR